MELDTAGDSVRWPYQTVINWKWETEIKIPSRRVRWDSSAVLFQGPVRRRKRKKKNELPCSKRRLYDMVFANLTVQAAWFRLQLALAEQYSFSISSHLRWFSLKSIFGCDRSGSANRVVRHAFWAVELFQASGGPISIQKVTNSNLDLIRS